MGNKTHGEVIHLPACQIENLLLLGHPMKIGCPIGFGRILTPLFLLGLFSKFEQLWILLLGQSLFNWAKSKKQYGCQEAFCKMRPYQCCAIYQSAYSEGLKSVSIVFITWVLDHMVLFIPFLDMDMAVGCHFCLP